jgi:hypothetical protein
MVEMTPARPVLCLDLTCPDPEQSSILENLITSQAGSWEVFLKSQGGDGKSTPSGNFLI